MGTLSDRGDVDVSDAKDKALIEVKRVQPTGDPANLRLALTLNMTMIVGAKVGDMDRLKDVLEHAIDIVQRECKELGIDAFLYNGDVRPAPHEMLLAVQPRRIHYAPDGRQICDPPHVSPKNLTKKPGEVTCKKCLKIERPPPPIG